MAFVLNLIALLIVISLAYAGTMWLAGVIHRSKGPQEQNDLP